MIKFFRKIRQRLLSENKLSKYLLYAIGEIALVVIGILIALRINIWNEERKNENLEEEYLIALHEEFEENIQELHRVKRVNANNITAALELTKYTGPGEPAITDQKLSELLWRSLQNEVQYRPGNGIKNELISTGNLSLISNKELKRALASVDGLILKVRFQENKEVANERQRLFDLTDKSIGLRRMMDDHWGVANYLTPSKFNSSNLHILQSREFDNLITGFVMTSKFLQDNYYSQVESSILTILEKIETQLED